MFCRLSWPFRRLFLILTIKYLPDEVCRQNGNAMKAQFQQEDSICSGKVIHSTIGIRGHFISLRY